MEIKIYDLLFLLVFGSIAMNLLWRLLCYELRIHFADSYDDSFCCHYDPYVPYVFKFEDGKYDGCIYASVHFDAVYDHDVPAGIQVVPA